MDDTAPSPPEQADTEQGFGSGLREQLARNREARERELADGHDHDDAAVSPPGEAAVSASPGPEAIDDVERELDESFARSEELRRSLSARHARLAEWIASQGRELRSPEAAALLVSGVAEAELDRQREEAARLERLAAELAEREAALAEREHEIQARTYEVARERADAEQTLRSLREVDARASRLDAQEAEAAQREQRLAEKERELREREERFADAETLDATGTHLDERGDELAAYGRQLDERAAALDERERRVGKREDALGELKDWLVRRERELAAYLGDSAAPGA